MVFCSFFIQRHFMQQQFLWTMKHTYLLYVQLKKTKFVLHIFKYTSFPGQAPYTQTRYRGMPHTCIALAFYYWQLWCHWSSKLVGSPIVWLTPPISHSKPCPQLSTLLLWHHRRIGIVQARMGKGQRNKTPWRMQRGGWGWRVGRERSGPGLQSDFWMGVGLKSRKTGNVHVCSFALHVTSMYF